MKSRRGKWRDFWINRLLGVSIQDVTVGLQDSLTRIEKLVQQSSAIRDEDSRSLRQGEEALGRAEAAIRRMEATASAQAESQARIEQKLDFSHRRLTVEREIVRIKRDDLDSLRHQLAVMREAPDFSLVFEDREPLISVRIPAYKKTEELLDVAIASVLKQTYQNFEIVVVNDGPNARTREALESLADPRIRYFEFPEQSRYPEDPQSRWMVAGSPGMNRATELALGTWVAPLDDDDEFSPDHLEKLLALALDRRVELAYGALTQKHVIDGTQRRILSVPPAISEFSFMSALYLKKLDFFRYDVDSWMVDEPGDWNLIRRMCAAGVTMAATDDIVGVINMIPYTAKA
ncbi:glycosyltransferase family 2 protein [Cryobacterium algoricola]|uniref:Glycosyltransferase family 2 protein n=1 Tax=Cryobacterium algoricola TaxID=1259183 RepID=A0ABY2I7L9_9MICO|nr:glycosyltransferase [Cryobacterium algoricola]TFB82586.1 glycosyltransferase family 2 protein [Cryobacterium algoricola]